MSDQPDQPDQPQKQAVPIRKTGLSPKEQKLQALREKAANAKSGAKPLPGTAGASTSSFTAKNSFAGKKAAFQRKAT